MSTTTDWVSYRQAELADAWDVIVIGSGIGGLELIGSATPTG